MVDPFSACAMVLLAMIGGYEGGDECHFWGGCDSLLAVRLALLARVTLLVLLAQISQVVGGASLDAAAFQLLNCGARGDVGCGRQIQIAAQHKVGARRSRAADLRKVDSCEAVAASDWRIARAVPSPNPLSPAPRTVR